MLPCIRCSACCRASAGLHAVDLRVAWANGWLHSGRSAAPSLVLCDGGYRI
uniref:Uncharacterized protein n=1 Tax=Fagus sylvatica TaxID=28930 RepID=A0A2N9H9Y6_FAGSY